MAAAPTARMMVIIMRPAVRKVLPMPLATMAMPRQTGMSPLNWVERYFETLPALLMPVAIELKVPKALPPTVSTRPRVEPKSWKVTMPKATWPISVFCSGVSARNQAASSLTRIDMALKYGVNDTAKSMPAFFSWFMVICICSDGVSIFS